MYTKKPVKSVEDLAGMKIRVQTSKTMVKMTELLGGSPSPRVLERSIQHYNKGL